MSLLPITILDALSIATALVANDLALRSCLQDSEEECTIVAGTTIYPSSEYNFTRNVTLRGEGNSVIDLRHNTTFASFMGNYYIVIRDLEIRNGAGTSYGLFQLSSGYNLNLTNVYIRNIASGGGGPTVLAWSGSGTCTFKNVTFHNCSALSGNPTVVRALNPRNWILEDLHFINVSTMAYSNPILNFLASGDITFGGRIQFDTPSQGQSYAVAFAPVTTSQPLAIKSNPSNPAHWIFSQVPAPMYFNPGSAAITFEAASFSVSVSNSPTSPYSAITTYGPYAVNITIHGDLSVDGIGAIYSTAPTIAKLEGKLSAVNCRASHVLLASDGGLFISATEILIQDPSNFGMNINNGALTVQTSGDLRIWRSNPSVFASSSVISTTNPATLTLNIGGSFNISNFQRASAGNAAFSGAAIDAGALTSIQISTTTATFFRNSASYSGGAISIQSGANFSLITTGGTTFTNNMAKSGGAFSAIAPANLWISGSLLFDSNTAQNGSALEILSDHRDIFTSASFISNVATQNCIVRFSDSCAPFQTTGIVLGNQQQLFEDPASCPSVATLCRTAAPVPGSTCSGSPPSTGTWTCIDGQWVSIGSIDSSTSVTIPSTQVIVKGNLTVSGTIVFTGLESSVVIEDGCATIDGSLQVQLSDGDLETIASMSGSSRTSNLLSQSSNCSSLASISLVTTKSSKSCRKVSSSISHDSSDGFKTTLVAVFTVNSSGCNVKWIILGCVLGGVLLLALVLALVFTFNQKAKSLARPFWARGKADAQESIS